MMYWPRYRSAEVIHGRPLVFFQRTCELVMSPVPPVFRANALFLPSDMNLIIVSHSSRVIFPSLLASWLSKKPPKALSASSLDSAPSPSLSKSLSMESNDGILNSLSSAPPPPPAKKRVPSATTGEGMHPEG